MEAAGTGIGHVGGDGPQLQTGHEGLRGLPPALHPEAHHPAGTVGQVLPGQLEVGVPGKAAVAHPGDFGVALEELRNGLGVLTVAGHAHMEALQAQVQDEGALWAHHGAEIPHELSRGLLDEGALPAEPLRVDHAVVALVRVCYGKS